MTDTAELDAPAVRRSLAYRFWSLWVSVWSAWCEPFDVGL